MTPLALGAATIRDIASLMTLSPPSRCANRPVLIGLLGNAADIFPELVRRGVRLDLVTDQTSAHDPANGYLPQGWTTAEWEARRERDPAGVAAAARRSIAATCRQCSPFTAWACLLWITATTSAGSPGKRAWPMPSPSLIPCRPTATAPHLDATRGELKAPIVIARDHLDSGSVASPNRETEAMRDGSNAVSDRSFLNALPNCTSGPTWVAIHHGGGTGMGYSQHAGMVIVADGTEAAARLRALERSCKRRDAACRRRLRRGNRLRQGAPSRSPRRSRLTPWHPCNARVPLMGC